jgi:hypothetical protein
MERREGFELPPSNSMRLKLNFVSIPSCLQTAEAETAVPTSWETGSKTVRSPDACRKALKPR